MSAKIILMTFPVKIITFSKKLLFSSFHYVKFVTWMLVFSWLYVGCVGNQTDLKTTTADNLIEESYSISSDTPTPVLQATLLSIRPSITPRPARPTRTPTSTWLPDVQVSREAEVTMEAFWKEVRATEIALFPGCGGPADRYYSPNGKWVAITCTEPMTGVYNLDNLSKVWVLSYIETYGTHGYFKPVHWSVDGRYLYLAAYPCCIDGGCPAYRDGQALLRLDLVTGWVTQTVKPVQEDTFYDFSFYNFSFSKDDQFLAYVRLKWMQPEMKIVSLITGETHRITLDDQYVDAGNVVWSPDKRRIVFSARSGGDCPDMVYYLLMMDLSQSGQTVLADGLAVDAAPIEWTEDNSIILYMGWENGGYGSLDLDTFEIAPYKSDKFLQRP